MLNGKINTTVLILFLTHPATYCEYIPNGFRAGKKEIKWQLINGTQRTNRKMICAARKNHVNIKIGYYQAEYRLWNSICSYQFTGIEDALALGADVNYSIPHHVPLLHLLINHMGSTRYGEELCLRLLNKGMNPNKRNYDDTPLMAAIRSSCKVEICKALLNAQADILIKDNDGNTALHHAIQSYNNEGYLLLLSHQKKREAPVVALLCCLKHHAHSSGKMLYHLRKDLLRAYLAPYTVKMLINIKNNKGEAAGDSLIHLGK